MWDLMWDLIASVPDHCLSFYFDSRIMISKMSDTVDFETVLYSPVVGI